MSWEDQGRQQHGWFGHGAGGAAPPQGRTAAIKLTSSAVASLPASQRGSVESWLARGGVDQVATALPGWVAGAALPAGEFHDTVFGPKGTQTLAAHAQAVGQAVAGDPASAAAGRRFAALIQAAPSGGMARVMAGAVSQAGTPPVRALVEKAASRSTQQVGRSTSARAAGQLTDAEFKQRNIDDLANVIYNEAGGNGELAMTAVGSTVWNRMLRNHVSAVSSVSGGYNNKVAAPTASKDVAALALARRIAEGILNGTTVDPTRGATHYYSPVNMPTENETTHGDVGGGLETVPGVTKGGKAVRNYVPSYVSSFTRKPVAGIPDHDFKFYEQPSGGSRVR